MVETFLLQLPSLSTSERDSLLAAIAHPPNQPHWVIRTTFPLEETLQSRLVQGIQSNLPAQVPSESFTFETCSDYSCGIAIHPSVKDCWAVFSMRPDSRSMVKGW